MGSLLSLALSYAVLFACGSGLYFAICPRRFRSAKLLLWIIPFYGACSLILIASYAIELETTIKHVVLLSLCVSIFSWSSAFFLQSRRSRLRDLSAIRAVRRDLGFLVFLPAVLAIVLLLPNLKSWQAETAFHIGPDQALGAAGAQFLLGEGRLSELRERLERETDTKSVRDALNRYDDLIDYTTYLQACNLLHGLRWGIPALTASITSFFQAKFASRFMYSLLPIFQSGLYFLSYWLLSSVWRMERRWAALGASALTLNCNILNVMIEGGHAQIFAVPALLVLWVMFFCMPAKTWRETILQTLLAMFCFGFLLLTYSDLCYLAIALGGFGLALDLVFGVGGLRAWRSKIGAFLPLSLGLVAAAIVNFVHLEFSLELLGNKLAVNKAGGFWQPYWALPSEIFGFIDMYILGGSITQLLPRSPLALASGIVISLAIAFVLIRSRSVVSAHLKWWAAPLGLVLIIFIKQQFFGGLNNYQYMKAYTYMLPMLWTTWWASALFFAGQNPWRKVLVCVAGFAVIVTGLQYQAYMLEHGFVTNSSDEQLANYAQEYHFSDSIMFSTQSDIQEIMLATYMPFHWGNQGKEINDKPNRSYLDKDVYLLVSTRGLTCKDCLLKKVSQMKFLLQTPEYLVIGTGHRLQDGVDAKSGRIDVNYFYKMFL